MLSTNQKGALAEAAIVHAALKLGLDVYRPVSEGGRCDLIFGIDSRLVRVQCKLAFRRGDVLEVRLYSSRRSRAGCVRRAYTTDDVDAIAAYSVELDRCFLLPMNRFEGSLSVSLRLARARNNQRRGVNNADDFSLESLNLGSYPGP
jgi:hypothetical protein